MWYLNNRPLEQSRKLFAIYLLCTLILRQQDIYTVVVFFKLQISTWILEV